MPSGKVIVVAVGGAIAVTVAAFAYKAYAVQNYYWIVNPLNGSVLDQSSSTTQAAEVAKAQNLANSMNLTLQVRFGQTQALSQLITTVTPNPGPPGTTNVTVAVVDDGTGTPIYTASSTAATPRSSPSTTRRSTTDTSRSDR
jgi:type II secretory pathway pseudopilin PulG